MTLTQRSLIHIEISAHLSMGLLRAVKKFVRDWKSIYSVSVMKIVHHIKRWIKEYIANYSIFFRSPKTKYQQPTKKQKPVKY